MFFDWFITVTQHSISTGGRNVDWGNLTFAEYTPLYLRQVKANFYKYGVVYWYWWHFVIRIFFIVSLTLWRGFSSVGGWVREDYMLFVLSYQLSEYTIREHKHDINKLQNIIHK